MPNTGTTVVDTFDDLSKTDSHTSGIQLDSANSTYFDNDSSRLGRSSNTTQSITYHYTDINSFSARIYWYPSDYYVGSVNFYASPDGSTWRLVTMTIGPDLGPNTGRGWTNVASEWVPAGTNYLKVEITDATYVADGAEVGYMSITYGQETNTTPAVEYAYDTAANGSRLISMTYPDGRVIHYSYNTGLDSDIGRLSAMADDNGVGGAGTTLESYKYLGLSTVVERDHPEDGINLTMIKLAGESNGDAGDQYTGLDRFGRVVDQRWLDSNNSNASVDEYQYSYDRDGNVTSKINVNATSNNETYTYNGLQ